MYGNPTNRQLYKELGHEPDNYSDGDKPVADESSIAPDNDHNNLVKAKAVAKKKLDEYLFSVAKNK